MNQGYCRLVAKYKQGKSDFYWDSNLDRVQRKRNNQMRDAINKAARFIVNRCLADGIGNLIMGWNDGQKNGSQMGKRNNQNFMPIPTGRLIELLKQLCPEYGIVLTVTQEAYTSKASVRFVLEKPRNGGIPGSNKVIQPGLSTHFNPLLDDNLFVLWVRDNLKSHPAGAAVKALSPGSRLAINA